MAILRVYGSCTKHERCVIIKIIPLLFGHFWYGLLRSSSKKILWEMSENLKENTCARVFIIEAATRGVPYKKVFLKISQNSQEDTCAWVFFSIKLQAYTFFTEQLRTAASIIKYEVKIYCDFWNFLRITWEQLPLLYIS